MGGAEPEIKYSIFQSYFLLENRCFLSARKTLPNAVGVNQDSCHQEFGSLLPLGVHRGLSFFSKVA